MNNTENRRKTLTLDYERGYSYDVYVDMTMCGPGGAVTPSGWQKLVVSMIERHLRNIGMGEQELLDRLGMSWILLSTHITIMRRVRLGEHLMARTWNSGTTPPIFRRDYEFIGEDGTRAAVGASYSTLLSVGDRKFCTDRAIIESLWLPEGEKLSQAPRRAPRIDDSAFVPVGDRTALPSMTDGMGHVNNTRYGEFVYDALTPDERAAVGGLSAVDVWFFAEIREGTVFSVRRAELPDGVAVCGVLPDGTRSFLMKLTSGEKDRV